MEEIRFNSEVLNKIMTEKTRKESFTKEKIKKGLSYMELDLQGEQVTQEDINLLVEILNGLKLKNADLSNVNIRKMRLERLELNGCVIPEDFFEESEIGYVTLGAMELQNGGVEKASKSRSVNSITLLGERKLNAKTILKDYPDFDSLDIMEKYDITNNPYYRLPQYADLSSLTKVEGLEKLDLYNVEISQSNANAIAMIKNLKELGISDTNLTANVILPQISGLKELLLSGNIQSLNIISQQKNVTSLTIGQDGKNDIDTSELRDFSNLRDLVLSNFRGVEENLPKANGIENIILKNCGIQNATRSVLNRYPKLTQMNLDRNPLSDTSVEDMKKAKIERGIIISFKESQVYEKLNSQVLKVSSEELEKKIKQYLSIYSSDSMSQYDVLVASPWGQTIKDVDVLNEISRLGIADLALKKIKNVEVESWELLSPETQEILKKGQKRTIEISALNGLSVENLKELEKNKNIKIKVTHDSHGEYRPEELIPIIEVMKQIKSQIQSDASEYEKFKMVYNIIGKSANYDHSGCQGSREYVEGAENITRSLKGVLLEGRAVCVGYALALEKCLKYIGIDAKHVSGYAYGKKENAHAWNQVCIDGKWYNADLTWDSKRLQRGMPLEYCLVGDEKFNQEHTASTYEGNIAQKCTDDYSLNEVGVMADKPTRTTFGKGIPILFGIDEFKTVAHETVIEQSMLDGIKKEIKKSQEQSKIKEENEK